MASALEHELRTIFDKVPAQAPAAEQPSLADEAIAAVEGDRPNAIILVRKFMQDLDGRLEDLSLTVDAYNAMPDPKNTLYEMFVQRLDESRPVVAEFSRVAVAIAVTTSPGIANELYRGFERILSHYEPNVRGAGLIGYHDLDFDVFRFIGHEMFVSFISVFMALDRWATIADLLGRALILDYAPSSGHTPFNFGRLSYAVEVLSDHYKRYDGGTIYPHARLLYKRHSEGELATLVPANQFMDADYLLLLRGTLPDDGDESFSHWRPWSTLYMGSQAPGFLVKAYRKEAAEPIMRALGLKDLAKFRTRLPARANYLNQLFKFAYGLRPLANVRIDDIGTL